MTDSRDGFPTGNFLESGRDFLGRVYSAVCQGDAWFFAVGGLWGGGLGAGGRKRGRIKKERDGGRVSSVSHKISGGYLLSHRNSTIGVTGLNFSVRNGKRWIPGAIATLYDKTYWQK